MRKGIPREPKNQRAKRKAGKNLMALLTLAVMVVFLSFLFSSKNITPQFATFDTPTKPILATSPIELVDIPLNVNSSFVHSDVSQIIHIPSKNTIQVHFKPERKCQNPLLQGRISGWSLSMIEFGDLNGEIVEGQYDLSQIPLSGQYYVEILVVLCKKYGDDYRSIHLKDEAYCLEISEEDDSHQLTAGGKGMEDQQATIHLKVPPSRHDVMGRWIHNSLLSKGSLELLGKEEILLLPPPKPVFTPHQCNSTTQENNKAYCDAIGTKRRSNIYGYTYQWNPKTNEKLSKDHLTGFLPVTADNNPVSTEDYDGKGNGDINSSICFVGSSHARWLSKGCNALLQRTNEVVIQQKLNSSLINAVNCIFMEVKFPSVDEIPNQLKLNSGSMKGFGTNNCTHVVLGLFQWYMSHQNPMKKEVNFHKWKAGMVKTVQDIQDFAQSSPSSRIRQIYLRSAHANGFKRDMKLCPIVDARTPWNAKLATDIMMEIVDELRSNGNASSPEKRGPPPVSFLDSRFLLDPVWDSGEDWSHYKGKFLDLESKLLLSKILARD